MPRFRCPLASLSVVGRTELGLDRRALLVPFFMSLYSSAQ